ncbi:GTPase IMAP family member 8-like isoform X3 [Ctenopharyngodon idella]|uniref:GTPase IMAP family member 8-like isoform X3 n=1 Tax=Ctenopharyngodon idella TaxID=7959 RepID=UPI00222E8ED7|nr:GTPase IMAP family member 8-like isoform X3 [Ctenopharyngodon idella]
MANRLEIKRSQSPRGDRPNMSDLRIVLLGKNASENNRVGNLILDKKVFRKKTPQPDVEEHSERVEGRNITIINTIHLLKSKISQQKIAQKVSEFSSPEPDVIILVLQHNDFSERKRDRLLSVLNCFGEQAMKRTMILTTDDETHSAEKKHENEFIQQISTECGGGRLQLQNTQRSQILQKVDEILIRSGFKETQQSSSLNQVDKPSVFSMSKNQKLILAICGYNEEIKASMSKLLLGKNTAISAQESTSVRVWSDVEVHGRLISLVELPALNRLSEEEVKRQTLHCVSLCDPGVHVFLLIVPATPLTNEEREGIEKIQRIFSSGKHFILIFFTYLHIVEKATDFVKSSPESQRLISCCGGQYRVIGLKEPESSRQIPELLDYIENMKTEPYSLQMYVKAQENRVRNESKQKLQSEVGRSCPDFSRPISCDLRIVLLGKNVSENSRVGNLILGEDTFESEASSAERKLQQHRQGVGRHLEDRYVTVIISPQLLQTHLSLRHITQTVRECVNLSDPGPHAFILVLQYNDFTEEDMIRVKMILKEFSEEAIKHTIVITTDQESYRSYVYLGNRAIYHLIKDCGGAHLQLDERRPEWRSEVFEMVDKKLKENQEDCLTCDVFHDVRGTPMNEEQNISEEENDHRESDESDEVSANVSEKQKLNLVLCGSDATLKDSVSKLFRGKNMKPLHEGDIRSECVKKEKIHGRQISLVELPALSRLSEEEVMRQTLRCLSLCDPGVHVFLLIIPVGPLTDEDKAEIKIIQKIFYSREHFILLFTTELTAEGFATDFVKSSPEFQRLISLCGGQYRLMGLKEPENSKQIPDLLDYIENMKTQSYSPQLYVKAQENRARRELEEQHKEELKRMEDEIKELKQKIQSEETVTAGLDSGVQHYLFGHLHSGFQI